MKTKHPQPGVPDRVRVVVEMWNNWVRLSEIAQHTGYANARCVSAVISNARKRWPGMNIRPPDFKGGTRYDKQEDDQVIEMWSCGKPITDIARALGVGSTAVYRRVHRLVGDGKIKYRKRNGLANGGARQALLLNMWNSGDKATVIASAVGCSLHRVYQTLSELRKKGEHVVPRRK